MKSSRRLAAIMFTDIVGYTALMSNDEAKAFAVLNRNRSVQSKQIKRFRGKWLKEIGDGVLASFETVTDAVCCAAAIQNACKNDPSLNLRIGIHQGEVVFENGDVFGDGVNIASRIESHAPPGGIFVSRTVYQNISNNRNIQTIHVEDASLKNINYKVSIYDVTIPDRNYLDVVAEEKTAQPQGRKNKGVLLLGGLLILISISIIAWWALQETADTSSSPANSELLDADVDAKAIGVALPSGPRIAVLPFKNLSNDKEQEYFSDGLTEDIITALSRSDLFVLGFSPNLRQVMDLSVMEVGKELGVRYLLKGSVRRDANTLKVSAQLFDASTGGQIWDESYSRDLTVSDIFAVQDDITTRVVGALADGGFIARTNLQELQRNPTKDMGAYECVLRSYAYEGAHTAEAHLLARDCLESALELDSNYADALGILAYLYREEYAHDFNQRPNALERAVSLARKALEIDPLNQNAYYALAFTYFEYGATELDEFFLASERTITLNPNNTRVVAGLGVLIALAGEWQWGIDLLEKAVRINQYSSVRTWLNFIIATDHYHSGAFPEALREINKVSFRLPIVHINIISIHAKLGDKEKAVAALREAMSSDPLFLEDARTELEKFYLVDEDLVDMLMEGLHEAVSWM